MGLSLGEQVVRDVRLGGRRRGQGGRGGGGGQGRRGRGCQRRSRGRQLLTGIAEIGVELKDVFEAGLCHFIAASRQVGDPQLILVLQVGGLGALRLCIALRQAGPVTRVAGAAQNQYHHDCDAQADKREPAAGPPQRRRR